MFTKKVSVNDISVRNFTFDDIVPLADYWSSNSADFWAERGVDASKLKAKDELVSIYTEKLNTDGDIPGFCVITHNNKAIGIHGVTHVVGDESAIMHAHIWYAEYRKKGIAYFSYPLAMDFFMKKLNLKKIIFKTPKINVGANKVKQKLQIPCLGETIFDGPVLLKPLDANLYEVDRVLLDQILARTRD